MKINPRRDPEIDRAKELVRTVALHPTIQKGQFIDSILEHIEELKRLGGKQASRTRAQLERTLANYQRDMLKLKLEIECAKERNLEALGLKSANAPVTNIVNMSDEQLIELTQNVELSAEVVRDTEVLEQSLANIDNIQQDEGFEVVPNLFIGDKYSVHDKEGWAYVHACKSFHRKILGYSNSLDPSHKHYLHYERKNHLYLNIIDPEKPLFRKEVFIEGANFIKKWLGQGCKVLTHCDQGHSRGPTMALIYLAATNKIPNTAYKSARSKFNTMYPQYNPGEGIQKFLSNQDNWDAIMGGTLCVN